MTGNPPNSSAPRFIAHFDVDAFYASVAMRDDPTLRGKPVAIAGRSRRAVVLTASYEARPFGVRSAMPLYKAIAACPQLVVVAPDMATYRSVSREIFAILSARGNAVEGLSMDEAFVDLGAIALDRARNVTQAIRDEVLAATGLTVSAGLAAGKMVAKIASDACKPNGLLAIRPAHERAFLAPLPVGRLWGVGPKAQTRLQAFGITTIGDVATLDDGALAEFFGTWGVRIRDLARGIDSRDIEPHRATKSISTEETFEFDVCDEARLIDVLRLQAMDLAEKLREEKSAARTIGIKIKRADFTIVARQTQLTEPTQSARGLFRASSSCLRRAHIDGAAVRLLGTRLSSLEEEGAPLQMRLFAKPIAG